MNKHSRNEHPRAPFTEIEDAVLRACVGKFGGDWKIISVYMNGRSPRQCKERWEMYLNPNLNKGQWTESEDALLDRLVVEFGKQWTKISKFFEGRTSINVKNRFNKLKRRNEKSLKKKNVNINPEVLINQGSIFGDPQNSTSCDNLLLDIIPESFSENISFDGFESFEFCL